MKRFKTSHLWKRFLCGALSVLMIFGGGRSPTTIYADTIEHTHIWATKYDDKNHWEYCTVCGEKRNVTAHVFTETKERTSTASCDHYIHYYSCKCGYHYMYKKPHQIEAEWHGSGSRLVDHKNCINCGVWTQQAACQDASGKKIGCNNPGTCVRCGYTATANTHVLSQGTCKLCKKVFFKETSGPTITYSSDYKTCIITFTITPMDPSCILTGAESYGWTDTPNWSSRSMSSVLNSDGSRTFTQKIIFNTAIKSKANIGYGNSDRLERINGTNVYESNYLAVSVWYDHQAPVQNDVILKDQTSANGWATIKQLTLSGTENNSDVIYLTISDKATGEKYVTNAAVPVTDGKYSYTCTPSIEGDANGRTYVVTAKDHMGNISTKEFIVSKTDGSYPQLKSGTPLSYTDWTTSKNISLSFFDFGAGGVEASFDNQTDYKALTKSGEYYIWNHTFGNQTGTTEHTIYVRDALGNAGSYKLTVGNTDSTNYTVDYNLNGGLLSNQKTSYTVADSFILPTPTKTGYTFTGWTGSNNTTPQKTVTINKGTRKNLSYTANWIQINNTINYNVETVYPSWAGDKTPAGGTIDKTSEVVNGNNIPAGATAANYGNFVFDGWYSSSGELITKDATIKPLNCNAEDRGGFIYSSYGGSSVYDVSTDTYMVTTDMNQEEETAKETWGSGVYHHSAEIPWNNWYIAEFEVCSPIDAECIIDINNCGPNGHSWNGNDNDNLGTRFYNLKNGFIFSLKANIWKKIVIGYQNSNSKNTNHESLWDQHTINLRYDKSLGKQTFKIRNYKAAVSPTLIKELDTFTARFKPWEHTVTYNANGGTGAPESFQKCTWTSKWISSTVPTRTGYTFKNWNTKKDGSGTAYDPGQNYAPDQNGGTVTMYAQWQYNPVSVKVPQILIGDHTGKSQFRVKCDSIAAGSIAVAPDSSFNYTQDKLSVKANIKRKSSSSVIDKNNHFVVYDIITDKPLTAGCWKGSFNVKLTLTKE